MNVRLATLVVLTIMISSLGAVVLFGTLENLQLVVLGGVVWGVVGIMIFGALFIVSVFPSLDPDLNNPDLTKWPESTPPWFQDLLDNRNPLGSAVFAGILPVIMAGSIFLFFGICAYLILAFIVMKVMLKPPAHDPLPSRRDNFVDG